MDTISLPVTEPPWVTFKDGDLHINRVAGPVPGFLLEANQAVKAGDLQRAKDLLCPANIQGLESVVGAGPVRIDLMYMATTLLLTLGRHEQAEAWCRRIIQDQPDPAAYHHLARCFCDHLGRQTEALGYAQKAFEAESDNPWFCETYGRLLVSAGRQEEGIEVLKKAVAADPDDALWLSELLWYMHYVASYHRQDFYEGYREWGRLATAGIQARERFPNDPNPDRTLRIGLLSPDLHRSSAATTLEPFLDGYSRRALEVYGYGDLTGADEVTERMASKFYRLRDVRGMDSRRIATLVEQDGIDILVELAGHVQGNYLEVLAYRPAPVQADYGHIDTTGLEVIGYRITDALLDPPETQRYYVEQLTYLPGGMACFRPPKTSPLVSPLPARINGFVTFGTFNVNIKISDEILTLWARILLETPGSRLVMKFMAGHDPQIRARYLDQFARMGVDPARITIHGQVSAWGHLELFSQVDLALDTYPYNGGMTTQEGMWMGVPTVTLAGDTFVSRMGLNVLSRVGLEAFVSASAEEYVAKACALAGQMEVLEQIRFGLRPRMLDSSLCNPGRIAGEMEQALRRMWRSWCDRQVVS